MDIASEYARQLEQLPVKEVIPRFLDFEKDVQIRSLSPLVKLYASANTVNDIFTLDLSFGIGKLERPELTQLSSYLALLGTKERSFEAFRGELQTLGSALTFDLSENRFSIKINGFEANFSKTVALVSSFMQHAKAENKKMKQLVDEEKVIRKTFYKSTDNLAHALLEKVKYGDKSVYLNKLSLQDIRKLKGDGLLQVFHDIQLTACDIYYCGTSGIEEVAGCLKEHLHIEAVTRESLSPVYRPLREYDEPAVWFCDVPDASQSIIYTYIKGQALSDENARQAARLFSGYFGGDMSSLMFQEIREFRSFAYRTNGHYTLQPLNLYDKPGEFTAMLSTQSDKTIDAISVLNELIKDMPLKPDRLPSVRQSLVNQLNNAYPAFRSIPSRIASLLNEGYTADPNETLIAGLAQMQMDDVLRFYEENIKGRPVVYMIVGNARKIDMNKLAAFGNVIRIKKEELYN
jgi:hypothetical protein